MLNAEAFLANDRRRALAAGQALLAQAEGAVLFADISGFTPLTAHLARTLGPQRGAELLTHQLNQVYTRLIDRVLRWGGSVVGFSGDAITCWFDDAAEPGSGVQHAMAAGLALQEAMTSLAQVDVTPGVQARLALKVAIAGGPVLRFVVGDPAIQLIDGLGGAALDRLALVEHAAQPGEVLVDRVAAAAVAAPLRIVEWRAVEEGAEGEPVARLDQSAAPALPERPTPAASLPADLVQPWLLPAVRERLAAAEGTFLAELRPATALFLHFAGLDFVHDPAAPQRLDAFVRWVQAIVHRAGGSLIQLTTGDKGSYLYAAFGAPVAHDDDPLRAVAAALELRGAPATPAPITAVRIGIGHGLMRVGPYGSDSRLTYGVLGDETNLAARLMMAAEPGQILLSHSTAQQVERQVDLAALGLRTFKGKETPQEVFAVRGPRPVAGIRLAGLHAAPVMGRTAELARVAAALDSVRAGQGRLLRLEGEPGTGKSLLAGQLVHDAADRGLRVLVGACQSTAQSEPYRPLRTIVTDLLTGEGAAVVWDSREMDGRSAVLAIEQAWAANHPNWLPRLPLLGDLLGISLPDNATTAAFTARLRQEALTALVLEMVLAAAARRPVLVLVEDAHWLDEASQGVVLALLRMVSSAPLLLALVHRPAGSSPFWDEVTAVADQVAINLGELDDPAAAALVAARLGGPVDPLALSLVLALAQGNPFFLEELVDALRESGQLMAEDRAWQLSPSLVDTLRRSQCLAPDGEQWRLADGAPLTSARLGLPTSIHGLVLSRVDRLPESAKLTLKVASVVGRQFEVRLLAAAHPAHPTLPELQMHLEVVAARDLVRLDAPGAGESYLFKHNITVETVYQTLLESQRQELHVAVAQALERQQPDAVDRLAHHFSQGNLDAAAVHDKALAYLELAAQRAQRTYANEIALAYFDRIMQVELRWPAIKGRVEVLHSLGRRQQEEAALAVLEQYTPAEAGAQIELALLWASFHAEVGDFAAAKERLQQTQALAEESGSRRSLARSLAQSGLIAWRQGDYAASVEAYRAALPIVAGQPGLQDLESEVLYGLGLVYRQQGQLETAHTYFTQDLAIAQALEHKPNEARALNALGHVANLQRDFPGALVYYRRALAIREEIGDRAGIGASLLSIAQTLGSLGDHSQAEPLLRRALHIQQSIHNRWEETLIWNELGISYMLIGAWERAAASLEQGLRLARAMGSDIAAAYLLCNLGQVQRDAGQLAAADATLRTALGMAQAQGDVSLEAICCGDLALTSLRVGRFADARDLAESALGLFTQLDQPLSTTSVLATLAQAQLALGEQAAALTSARRCLAILDGCGGEGPDFPHRDYWSCAGVLAATGDTAEAARARRRAGELLRARADRLSDEEMRRALLENVAVHREILQAETPTEMRAEE